MVMVAVAVIATGVTSALGCLHCVYMGSVVNILEVHVASNFRVNVYRVGEFVYILYFLDSKKHP
jgi:hypothetical protein